MAMSDLELKIEILERYIENEKGKISRSRSTSINLIFVGLSTLSFVSILSFAGEINALTVISICISVILIMEEIKSIFIELPSKKRLLQCEEIELEYLKEQLDGCKE